MSITKNANGKWVTSSDDSREFTLRIDALNHEKRLEYRPTSYNADPRRLGELVDAWHKMHGRTLRDSMRRYKLLWRITDRLGNPIATNVDNLMFARYREQRIKEVSTVTANREHAYLRAVFNELRRLGVVDYENPLAKIRQFREREGELRFLTAEEIELLLETCQKSSNPSLVYIVKICLATGARWSEAENLKASQIQDGKITYLNTKSGKNRTVPISQTLFDSLLSLRKIGDEPLFVHSLGAFRRAIASSRIRLPKGQMSHVLRHSFASHFVMNGGNIVVLKDILGHSTITTTMRYAHLAPDHLSDAVELNPLDNPAG